MKELRFYGSSDDLIEVEGDVPGADEYNGEIALFGVAGLFVRVWYGGFSGCWGIAVEQVDEDTPVLAENMRLAVKMREVGPDAGRVGYSMLLTMDVPDDSRVDYRGDEAPV